MAGKSWHPTTQKGEEMGTCHTDKTLEIKHLAEGGTGEGKQLLQRVLALKKLLMLKEMLTKQSASTPFGPRKCEILAHAHS